MVGVEEVLGSGAAQALVVRAPATREFLRHWGMGAGVSLRGERFGLYCPGEMGQCDANGLSFSVSVISKDLVGQCAML